MDFDPCEHKIRQIVIKAGIAIRRAKGLPEEKNITNLYEMASKELGIGIRVLNTGMINHLPTPEESARENPNSKLAIICPKCGEKSYVLHPICKDCTDSEGGKYKTMFICYKCKHKEKFEKFLTQWLNELEIELPDGMKKNLGIKTVTNKGLE